MLQETIYRWLTVEFFVWFLLAIYFDNVLPDANGVRKPWTYFLRPSYWTGKGAKTYEGSCISKLRSSSRLSWLSAHSLHPTQSVVVVVAGGGRINASCGFDKDSSSLCKMRAIIISIAYFTFFGQDCNELLVC